MKVLRLFGPMVLKYSYSAESTIKIIMTISQDHLKPMVLWSVSATAFLFFLFWRFQLFGDTLVD